VVTANASSSTDPEGQPLSYRFDFGDGIVAGPQSSATATHTYGAAGNYQVSLTATDSGGLSSSATASVNIARPATAPVKYIGQIATNYSTNRHTSGSVTVWRAGGVTAGNLMVVTASLTGTTAGTVSGTDGAGDALTVASDILDATGHRLIVLSGVASTGLAPNQTVTVSFPSAATYRITADEVQGASVPDAHAEAAGTSTAFSSGPTGTTTAADFVFSTVGAYSGSAPAWTAGWSALSSYAVGADYLGRAYQVSSGPGSFTGSGTTSGSWLAATVAFR
jgi:PKD repeat protein